MNSVTQRPSTMHFLGQAALDVDVRRHIENNDGEFVETAVCVPLNHDRFAFVVIEEDGDILWAKSGVVR